MVADEESLAALLRRHRVRAGLTQEELAERAGISTRSVSDIERGVRKRIYRDTAARLAEALGLARPDRHHMESTARGRTRASGGPDAEQDADHRTFVPVPPTRLLGREHEVETILALLRRPEVRLLTLTGSGGVGKTRLALEIARRVDRGEGAVFVSLADTMEPGLVPSLVADALGVVPGGNSAAEAVTSHLRDRNLLLVLDTFEHVLEAAPLVGDLLASCPGVALLATSRAILRLRAEHVIRVAPLELLGMDGNIESSPAVALFFERARAVKPELRIDGEAASIVADICGRLEGVPLAIELAAARVRHLSLGALRDHLDHRLWLLTGGPRDVPPRHQAMRDTVAWSYDLLKPVTQQLFGRVSIFAGGWTLEATVAVCLLSTGDALEQISALVDAGLTVAADTPHGPRFTMLDVVREFAAERCDETDDPAAFARRHADYFATLVEEAEPQLGEAAQETWLDRLGAERQNIRAVLRWTIDAGDAALALRIAGALWRAWQIGGDLVEGRSWLREVLRVDTGRHPQLRSKTLWGAAWLAVHQGDYDEAGRLSDELLVIERSLHDPIGTRNALTVRGMVAMGRKRPAAALPPLRECVDICRGVGRSWYLATSLLNLAQPMMQLGHLAAADALLQEAHELYQKVGDRRFAARAIAYRGHTALLVGDMNGARSLFGSGLREFDEIGDQGGIAEAVAGLSAVSAAEADAIRAARLAGAAEALRKSRGAQALPFEYAITDRFLQHARDRVGEEVWSHAWDEGHAMAQGSALELALAPSPESA